MASCKCPVCSGRRRWYVTHALSANAVTLTIARNPDRVAILIGVRGDINLAASVFNTLRVFNGDSVAGDPIVVSELKNPFVMRIEDLGQIVQNQLTFDCIDAAFSLSVTELILREEDDHEGSMTALVGK